VNDTGSEWEVLTQPDTFDAVKDALASAQIEISSAEVTKRPQNAVRVDGDEAKTVLRLMEALEDHDDVQEVYANFDIDDEVFAQL
jgi:transcriptional/translational regulatory protein YebC/TACO1